MATIDLGKIKMVWRSAYNNATAYTIDDVVSHNGTSYICIAATTGNTPPNATYWNVLAQGGTDLGATLSNNQVAIKNNSGNIAGVNIGTAGQVFKVNSGANGYEFGSISSDFVKIASADLSSDTTTITFDNLFDDSVYSHYYVMFNNLASTGNDGQPRIRVLDSSGSLKSSSTYSTISQGLYTTSSTNDSPQNRAKWNYDHIQMTSTWTYHTPQDSSPCSHSGWFKIFDPQNANTRTHFQGYHSMWNGDSSIAWIAEHFAGSRNASENNRGFTMYTHDGSSFLGTSNSQHPTAAVIMYGIKK